MSRKYPGQASITVSLTSLEEYSVSEYQATFTILKPSSDNRESLAVQDEETDIEEDDEFLEYSEVSEPCDLTNQIPGPDWPRPQRKIRKDSRKSSQLLNAIFQIMTNMSNKPLDL